MTLNGWIQIAIYCLAIIVCVKPLGLYMARVFEGEITFLAPVERFLYRVCGVKGEEQHWTTYTIAMLAFSIAGFVSLYLMQRLQAALPFNPAGLATRSHSEYVEGEGLVDMIKENLIAERIAIDTYGEIIRYLGNDDPTTRVMFESILATEEEHAEDMLTLLDGLSDSGDA